jgi:hypothetical protein
MAGALHVEPGHGVQPPLTGITSTYRLKRPPPSTPLEWFDLDSDNNEERGGDRSIRHQSSLKLSLTAASPEVISFTSLVGEINVQPFSINSDA